MYRYFIPLVALLTLACSPAVENDPSVTYENKMKRDYALVIHGGAGTILKENMTPEMEAAYRKVLKESLEIGQEILAGGGKSIDAVEKVIHHMEDSPLFNAGKGAVFTNDGKNEHDASIMEGRTQEAGAVGGIGIVRHPISAARAVLEKSNHVLLTGKGAEQFAIENELETVDPSYFYTEHRWKSLQGVKEEEEREKKPISKVSEDDKFGTVGAVALDKYGDIVAGTSTGGMTNKRYDRFGDSPIIGAGTYANNATCGVSCTGHGEYFIRFAVAHDVSAMMDYKGISLSEAADKIVNEKLVEKGGSGGLVALDAMGNIAMPFNTAGMYRGYVTPENLEVFIYKEE